MMTGTSLGPDAPDHLCAVQLRQHDVEHDEVRLVALEGLQGGLAVAGDLDLEPLPLERVGEHLLERRLVVHQEYLARNALYILHHRRPRPSKRQPEPPRG